MRVPNIPSRRRRANTGEKALAVVLILALFAGIFLFTALCVMLLWGAVGATFFNTGEFRTIGFGTACLVTLTLTLVGGFFKSN